MKLLNLTFVLVSQALLANVVLGAAIPKDVVSRDLHYHETTPVLANGEQYSSTSQLTARGPFSRNKGKNRQGSSSFGSSSAGSTASLPLSGAGIDPLTGGPTGAASMGTMPGGRTSRFTGLRNAASRAKSWGSQTASSIAASTRTRYQKLRTNWNNRQQGGQFGASGLDPTGMNTMPLDANSAAFGSTAPGVSTGAPSDMAALDDPYAQQPAMAGQVA